MADVKGKKAEVIIIGHSTISEATRTQANAVALEKAGDVILKIAEDFGKSLTQAEFDAFQAEAEDHILFLSKMQRLLDTRQVSTPVLAGAEEEVEVEVEAAEETPKAKTPKASKAAKAKATKAKAVKVEEPAAEEPSIEEEPADGKDALAKALDLIGCPIPEEKPQAEDTSVPADAVSGGDTTVDAEAVAQAAVSSNAANRLAAIRAKAQAQK